MLAKPILKKPAQQDEEPVARQTRPSEERYIVKVDGQAKRSFASKDAAGTWGGEIKKKYP